MKAAVLTKPSVIECIQVDEPKVLPETVKIKVHYCGICGSDLPRVFDGTAKYYPLILGHEFSGEVTEIGEGVTGIEIGDYVAGVPLIPCMVCKECKDGNYSACKQYSFIGSRQNGAMSEYVVVPKQNVVILPKNIDLELAATIEPATVAYHALLLSGEIKNKNVAVIGCGIIGIYSIILSRLLGASHVVAIGRGVEGLKAAKQANADEVYSALDNSDINESFDTIIECSGSTDAIHQSFELAKTHGKICLIGTPKHDINFKVNEWELINRKEINIIGSWMSYSGSFPGKEWDDIVRMLSNGDIKQENVFYNVHSINDSPMVFNYLHCNKIKGRVLLKMD